MRVEDTKSCSPSTLDRVSGLEDNACSPDIRRKQIMFRRLLKKDSLGEKMSRPVVHAKAMERRGLSFFAVWVLDRHKSKFEREAAAIRKKAV